MTFRPELEIWVQTIPCELRLDCELAMLHYHVSDQVFYDMDEVNAVYPDGLPIMQPENKKYLHISELGSTSVAMVAPGDAGVEWDGKVGSMVFRKDDAGNKIPIGIATGQGTVDDRFDPPNWSPTVNVMTSGVFTAPVGTPPPFASLPAGLRPANSTPMVLPPDPNISPGDQITVHSADGSRKDYSVVGTLAEGGLVINYDKSPEELDDASLFRMRDRMMNGLSIDFPLNPPFLGNY